MASRMADLLRSIERLRTRPLPDGDKTSGGLLDKRGCTRKTGNSIRFEEGSVFIGPVGMAAQSHPPTRLSQRPQATTSLVARKLAECPWGLCHPLAISHDDLETRSPVPMGPGLETTGGVSFCRTPDWPQNGCPICSRVKSHQSTAFSSPLLSLRPWRLGGSILFSSQLRGEESRQAIKHKGQIDWKMGHAMR